MGTFAGEDDLKNIGRGHHRAWADGEAADRQTRPVVHAVDRLDRKRLEQSLLDHQATARLVLLGRLKNETDRPTEPPRLRKVAGCPKEHDGVSIVSTCMHRVGHGRTVGKVVCFGHRQSIHIGAKPDGRAVAAAKASDDARFRQAAVDLNPELLKPVCDKPGRSVLLNAGSGWACR